MHTRLNKERVRLEVARLDMERLQGVWVTVAGRREAQLLITGDHFTMRFRNGDIYVGIFKIDPTERPRAMDLTILAGPEYHLGKTALAIYSLDGDHLIWSPAAPGSTQRPATFPAHDEIEPLCLIFRRERS